MLPATIQFVIAMIACAINERMQRKLDYTQVDVRVLKEILSVITGSRRIAFIADQRRRLAVLNLGAGQNGTEEHACEQRYGDGSAGEERRPLAKRRCKRNADRLDATP